MSNQYKIVSMPPKAISINFQKVVFQIHLTWILFKLICSCSILRYPTCGYSNMY